MYMLLVFTWINKILLSSKKFKMAVSFSNEYFSVMRRSVLMILLSQLIVDA